LARRKYLHNGTQTITINITEISLQRLTSLIKVLTHKLPKLTRLTLCHPGHTVCYTPASEKSDEDSSVWNEVDVYLDIASSMETTDFEKDVSTVLKKYRLKNTRWYSVIWR
jgi:hypothetical protein